MEINIKNIPVGPFEKGDIIQHKTNILDIGIIFEVPSKGATFNHYRVFFFTSDKLGAWMLDGIELLEYKLYKGTLELSNN